MHRITRLILVALVLLLTGGVTPTATAAPSTQAQALVGQRIIVCKGDANFRVAVVSADSRRTIVDRPAKPGFMWVVAKADLTNLGADYGYPQGLVGIRDGRGRLFDWVLFNGQDEYVEDQLANEYDVTPSWAGAGPGATTRTVLIFLVAADATALTMVPTDIACSGDIVATSAAPAGNPPAPRPAPPAPNPNPPAPVPPAAPAPPPAAPAGGAQRTAAASLSGQFVTACKGTERYSFSLVSAESRRTIADRTAPTGMIWIVAKADVTNLSSAYGYFQGLVAVRDERNRAFDWVLFNGQDEYVEDQLANEYNLTPSWAGTDAGSTLRVVIPFLVSANATSLTLVPNNLGCGG